MKIYEGFDRIKSEDIPGGTVVTVGTFDGIHTAHAELLRILTEKARSLGAKSAVVSFRPHPRAFFCPQGDLRLLSDETEKAAMIEQAGVDILIIQPFSRAFAALTAEEFLRDDLIGILGAKAIVTGYDHSFGREKKNAYEFLRENGNTYPVEPILVPRMEYNGITVSSSSVRRAVEGGDVLLAEKLLGRPYSLHGKVVRGKQLGRTIGYPTANIEIVETSKLLPPDGVYAVRVLLDGQAFGGMMNIGIRPTVDDYPGRSVEVNIFDFDRDIYGQSLAVEIVAWIRSEVKFSSIDNLKEQLGKDAVKCRQVLANAL